MLSGDAISETAELRRILAIPRRSITEPEGLTLASEFSAVLRTESGNMTLRPIQAYALHDAGLYGGLFAPIRVGGGKTLVSLLMPVVTMAQRPLLLIPASLVNKTRRELSHLSEHWRIPRNIRILSYEMLGRPQSEQTLLVYRPDVIIADEAHRLKNRKAAVTRRVHRYMKANPATKFVAMSGTITKRSLKDYSHIVEWCIKRNQHTDCPVPHRYEELERWADALDEKVNPLRRLAPGALLLMADDSDFEGAEDDTSVARRAYRRRLTETPGIVATREGHTGCSLYIATEVVPKCSRQLEAAFAKLRTDWETPDGWPLSDPMSLWRHVRELALGFFYRWNPRPPESWLLARRAWCKFVREVINDSSHGRNPLDTEFMVAKACSDGRIDRALYDEWKKVEPTFTPKTEAVWLDDYVIDRCSEWVAHNPKGIVWSEHVTFGERLAMKAGIPFFQNQGRDKSGRLIEDASGPIIASIASNSTGRNLQSWNQNLIPSCPPNGQQWEQLIGRTHRDGQEEDEVTFTVLLSCIEHLGAVEQSLRDARYIEDSQGQSQKLLYADLTAHTKEDIREQVEWGYRWQKVTS